MEPLYEVNGLVFWTEREIRLRETFTRHFAAELQTTLVGMNPAWRFIQIEAPLLTPRSLINPNYTVGDIWLQGPGSMEQLDSEFRRWIVEHPISDILPTLRRSAEQNHMGDDPGGEDALVELVECFDDLQVRLKGDLTVEPYRPWYADLFKLWLEHLNKIPTELVLRPETTPGSYAYARHLFDSQSGVRPPVAVWQAGKSFRRENEQPYKHMRLKEFYQQEFQCIYSDDTKMDYHGAILEPVRLMIAELVGLPARIVESDRLPSYSRTTMDVEVDNGDKWMEVCSISLRTDFPGTYTYQGKGGKTERALLVLEVAIGLDRCVYNMERHREQIARTPGIGLSG